MADNLDVMLKENEILRQHMDDNFDHQIQMFTIIVSALGVIYGIAFAYIQARDLILLIPFITSILGLRSQYSNYVIGILGSYLEELEEKIKNALPADKRDWIGWQNNWKSKKDESKILAFDVLSKWLLFITLPMGISIYFSYLVISNFIKSGRAIIHTYLQPNEHLALALLFGSIIADTGIYFIIYKKLIKEKIIKKFIEKIKGTPRENNPVRPRNRSNLTGIILMLIIIVPSTLIGLLIVPKNFRFLFSLCLQISGIVSVSLWNVWTCGEPRLKVAVWLSTHFGNSPATAFQNFFVAIGLGLVLSGLLIQIL